MKFANVRFDDPYDLAQYSHVFGHLMMQLELLDYARRDLERKGNKSSIQRSKEIRKLYKDTIYNCTYLTRSIIPDETLHDYTDLLSKKIGNQEKPAL